MLMRSSALHCCAWFASLCLKALRAFNHSQAHQALQCKCTIVSLLFSMACGHASHQFYDSTHVLYYRSAVRRPGGPSHYFTIVHSSHSRVFFLIVTPLNELLGRSWVFASLHTHSLQLISFSSVRRSVWPAVHDGLRPSFTCRPYVT